MSPTIPTVTLAEHWGAAIAARRKAVHLNQTILAALCGVEQQTVSKWEKGLATPRDNNKVALARALNTTVAELFAYPEGLS